MNKIQQEEGFIPESKIPDPKDEPASSPHGYNQPPRERKPGSLYNTPQSGQKQRNIEDSETKARESRQKLRSKKFSQIPRRGAPKEASMFKLSHEKTEVERMKERVEQNLLRAQVERDNVRTYSHLHSLNFFSFQIFSVI